MILTTKCTVPMIVSRASRSCPNWVYRSFSAHHSKIDGDNIAQNGMSLSSNFSDGTKTWRHTRLGQRTSGYETRVLSTEESRTSEYWKFRQFGDSAIRRTIICPKWESTGNRNTIHSACAQVLGNIASAVVESNPAYLQCIPH